MKDIILQTNHLIDNWIKYQIYLKEIPGVSIGICVGDSIVFKKEYGYASIRKKTKLTGNHLFRIASHSKLFTATAIMKLHCERKLSIDDLVVSHLPWFSSENSKNLEKITIKHLLTHSSGLTRDGIAAQWYHYHFPDITNIKEQVNNGISIIPPDTNLKYSNIGFTLLGQIIEYASGMKYTEYIQKNIIKPLNLENTFVDINKRIIENHAKGYTRKLPHQQRKMIPSIAAKVMASATGFSSTVLDLIQFYKAHRLGNDILLPDTIKKEMQTPQFCSKSLSLGLGFILKDIDNISCIGHGGAYPGYSSFSSMIFNQKVIIAVLTNAIDGCATELFTGIAKIIDYCVSNKEYFTSNGYDQNIDFSDFIGFYSTGWNTKLFSQIGPKLVSIDPEFENPLSRFQIHTYHGNSQFSEPGTFPMAAPFEQFQFLNDPINGNYFLDAHKGKNFSFYFK